MRTFHERNTRVDIWLVAIGTVVIEMICLILRFAFGLESTRDTASTIGVMTLGLRIHHGYVGAVMIVLGLFLLPRWNRAAIILGSALLASDLIHHFLVLWPITGSPQFDLFYS